MAERIQPGVARKNIGRQPDLPPRIEERHQWEFADVGPEHIPGIRDLFRTLHKMEDGRNGRPNMDAFHVFHEDINNFPTEWEDPQQVEKFDESLTKFYIDSKQPFKIKTTRTEEELEVSRHSKVVVRDGQVVGVHSRLTDDPYTTESDRKRAANGRLKMQYGHVTLIHPQYRGSLVGSALAVSIIDDGFADMEKENEIQLAKRASELADRLEKGEIGESDFTVNVQALYKQTPPKYQFTGCIDRKGDWGAIMSFAENLGFTPGWRREDSYEYRNAQGELVRGQRVILEKEKWQTERPKVVGKIMSKLNPGM